MQDPFFFPKFQHQIKLKEELQDLLNHKQDLMFHSLPSVMDYLQHSLANQDLNKHSKPDQVNLRCLVNNQDLREPKHDLHQDLLPDRLHRLFSKDLNNLEQLNNPADLVQGQPPHQLDFPYLTPPL